MSDHLHLAEKHILALSRQISVNRKMTDKVRRRMLDLCKERLPSLEELADSLCITPTQLQSKLLSENTTYYQLTERLRKDLSLRLLPERKLKIYQIAHLLGYADPYAYSLKFKKWTGALPSAFRRGNQKTESLDIF